MMAPDPSLSRASPLPHWTGGDHQPFVHRKTCGSRACSRRRRYSQHLYCLTHRFREQARSHFGAVLIASLVHTAKPVGAGLAREGVGIASISLPDTPLSRASSLPHWSCVDHQPFAHRKTCGSRACPRRRRYSQHLYCLTHRFREQARSHTGAVLIASLVHTAKPVGAGLAREGVGIASISIA
ncbi:hypothetical protein E4T63_15540 [Pseudomonas fluorescens]|uniref:Uncharacterized protein n=1 Tax=Pseudomonas fluorescens TaxID=294 RepID=A0AAP9CJC8_PSEFL|nr:hypothetical protein E4T63_15540 [Pseudomonas fluorescens]